MLTPEQIAARKGKLTASRVAPLMTGDGDKMRHYWQELTEHPDYVPDDYSDVWHVQFGSYTEPFNLHWYERKQKTPISRRGEVVIHPELPWAACTLDAWDDVNSCPIECKNTQGFEPLEIVIATYQPQMQWQMACTGASQCAISVILGAREPRVEYIDRDGEYIAEMIERGLQFMQCVWHNVPPVPFPMAVGPVDAAKHYDMSLSNTWTVQAARWLETRDAAKDNEAAAKVLKSIVPADAKSAFGHGVNIGRDKRGFLSLRKDKEQ